jgi:hypothetical protein
VCLGVDFNVLKEVAANHSFKKLLGAWTQLHSTPSITPSCPFDLKLTPLPFSSCSCPPGMDEIMRYIDRDASLSAVFRNPMPFVPPASA